MARHAGRDTADASLRCGRAVSLDLPVGLVARRHDDRIRLVDCFALGRDAAGQRVAAKLMTLLVEAERMWRVDERDAKASTDGQRYGRGISEVGVDQVRSLRQPCQMKAKRIREGRQLRCKRFLLEISPVVGGDAVYGGPGTEGFDRQRMLDTELVVVEQARDDGNLLHVRQACLCGSGIQHIGDVASRVRGQAEPHRWCLDTSTQRQVQYKQSLSQ